MHLLLTYDVMAALCICTLAAALIILGFDPRLRPPSDWDWF